MNREAEGVVSPSSRILPDREKKQAARAVRWSGVRVAMVALLPVAAFLISLPLGRYPVSLTELAGAVLARLGLINSTVPDAVNTVLFGVRLPRLLTAMLVGAALSMSGAAYQGMFRNPLVSPDILGAAAGAGFGAVLGIMLAKSVIVTQLLAFGFGLAAVLVTFLVAQRLQRGDPTLVLVLTGILVGTIFTSLISIMKFLADPYDKLPAITYWLMGSLAAVTMQDLLLLLAPVALGGIVLYLMRWQLNTLSFGDEEARTLGVETGKVRTVIIVAATMMTAASVATCGMVGWVGLVIPHLARSLVGPDYKVLLPVSLFLGSTFLLLVDDLARVVGTLELPLGVVTALVGAPWFLFLLARTRKGWM